MRVHGVLGILILNVWANPGFAQDVPRTRTDVNQEVVRTYAEIYLEQRDYVRAEEAIARYLFLSSEKGEGQLWQELGEIQEIQFKWVEACHSFQMAAADAQDKDGRLLGLYTQAQCLNRVGRVEDSQKVLAQMVKEESGITNAGERVLELIQSGYVRRNEGFPPYGANVRGQWRV
jgi:tetratricopeptide (TPR) repeat protein